MKSTVAIGIGATLLAVTTAGRGSTLVPTAAPRAAFVGERFGFREWYELDDEVRRRAAAIAAVALEREVVCIGGGCVVRERPFATICDEGDDAAVDEEPTIGHGTAFLVGRQDVMLAGHTVAALGVCRAGASAAMLRFVFDFRMDEPAVVHAASSSDIYEGDEVVECSTVRERDVAVVRLTTAVADRRPLPLSTAGTRPGAAVSSLGHPLGLPLKHVSGTLGSTSGPVWQASLNASHRSSGAPVFDVSGAVVGVIRAIEVPARLAPRPCAALAYCAATSCVTSIVPVRPHARR